MQVIDKLDTAQQRPCIQEAGQHLTHPMRLYAFSPCMLMRQQQLHKLMLYGPCRLHVSSPFWIPQALGMCPDFLEQQLTKLACSLLDLDKPSCAEKIATDFLPGIYFAQM